MPPSSSPLELTTMPVWDGAAYPNRSCHRHASIVVEEALRGILFDVAVRFKVVRSNEIDSVVKPLLLLRVDRPERRRLGWGAVVEVRKPARLSVLGGAVEHDVLRRHIIEILHTSA